MQNRLVDTELLCRALGVSVALIRAFDIPLPPNLQAGMPIFLLTNIR